MRRGTHYHVNFTTRHPLLKEVMDALQGSKSRRLSYFVATSLEAYLTTEEGKCAAQQVIRTCGQTRTGDRAESPHSESPGFNFDSILS